MRRNVIRLTRPAMALLLLGLLPGPASATDTLREESRAEFDASRWKAVEIENARGSVEVHSSHGTQARLTALKVVRGRDRSHSEEIARGVKVATEVRDGRFVITVHYPQHTEIHVGFWDLMSGVEYPRSEVRLSLEIPEGLTLAAHSSSGDLVTEGRTGAQTLESRSGDIEVRDARGPLDASSSSGDVTVNGMASGILHTSSGDIRIAGVSGPVRARSSSGDVQVHGAADSVAVASVSGDLTVEKAPRGLTAESSSGSIDARAVSGQARLSTSSGDISLGLMSPISRVDVTTSSGEIRSWLGDQLKCALDLRTTSGTLDLSIPLAIGTVNRHSVTGQVRGGGPPVSMRSSSGDIHIEGGER